MNQCCVTANVTRLAAACYEVREGRNVRCTEWWLRCIIVVVIWMTSSAAEVGGVGCHVSVGALVGWRWRVETVVTGEGHVRRATSTENRTITDLVVEPGSPTSIVSSFLCSLRFCRLLLQSSFSEVQGYSRILEGKSQESFGQDLSPCKVRNTRW